MSRTACAKTILFGEHAVVYGSSGIAVPIKDLILTVEATKSIGMDFETDFSLDPGQKKKLSEMLKFLLMRLRLSQDVHFKISSDIPIAAGLGSSAAISIASIRELSDHFSLDLDDDSMNKLAFECEKIFHGMPSGIDNTVINYARPIYYKAGNYEFFDMKNKLVMMLVYTGKKPDTKETVSGLRKRYAKDRTNHQKIFDEISLISDYARKALVSGDLLAVGKLMYANHELLKKLGVSSKALDDTVRIAADNGALGAKLVGAGKGGYAAMLLKNSQIDKFMNLFRDQRKQVVVIR